MTSTRYVLTAVAAAAFAGPSVAQPGSAYPDLVPSVRPVAAQEPVVPNKPRATNWVRPAAAAESLEGLTAPGAQFQAPAADPVGTLNGVGAAPAAPVGSYPSPYYVDGPGCCGPLGRHGRIGYDVYAYTGVNLVFGGGLPDFLNAGWTTGGGIRTLFFDPTYTAAWVVDYGLSYTHNWGQGSRDPVNLDLRQGNVFRTTLSGVREVHRTSFNFAIGRDVWLMGTGATGSLQEGETACRVGAWVGGRYGTAHVDITPLDEINGYARRQNAYEGITAGAHATFDRSFGGWILFGGVRAEYGYDWLNLIPPYQGNIHNVNIQLSLGIRY
jgi:hypothetical protein